MRLVADANELFAAIITSGKRLDSWALDILFSDDAELFAPSLLLAELERNREEIKAKSGFLETDFDSFVGILKLRIKFVPLEDFLEKMRDAKALAPHPKDIAYFALALKLGCPVWSEEKAFKSHSTVKTFNSRELAELLGLHKSEQSPQKLRTE